MYDLDPAVLSRRGGVSPIRTPDLRHRRLADELRVSWACARRAILDVEDHPAIFELLHHFPLGDVIRLVHPRLPILADPRFEALYAQRSLPALDTVGARALLDLPVESLGYGYARFVEERGLKDTFLDYLPAPEDPVAYLAWRTVLLHDLLHFILGYEPGDPVQEMQVEAFLLAQTGAFNHFLFMSGYTLNFITTRPRHLLAAPGALVTAFNRGRRADPLLLVPWQDELPRPLDEVRRRLGVDRR